MTKAWVRQMMGAFPKARPTKCVIRGRCRTWVYEFPKSELVADEPMQHAIMLEIPGKRITLVSDLVTYFRKETPFRHYQICCSLRSKVDDAIKTRAKASSAGRFPLFVVLERQTECDTTLDDGTCYVVGQEMVTGGQVGEEALTAWQVDDGPWPPAERDETEFVNMVLAAVKIVQDETNVIREVAEASCFCDGANRAVYPMSMTMNANLSVVSPVTAPEVAVRVAGMRRLIEAFGTKWRDGDQRMANLLDALRLENVDTNHYRRTWYLCLLEAVEAVLSGRAKQEFHQRHRRYRATIGHPTAQTKMDRDEFVRLQRDALSELRKIFLAN